jgi:hypothetical protein
MVNVIQLFPGYFNVRSHSGNGSYPVVNSSPDCTGSWSCECVGYRWRGKCSHIEDAKDFLASILVTKIRILEAKTVKPFFEALAKDLDRDSKIIRPTGAFSEAD